MKIVPMNRAKQVKKFIWDLKRPVPMNRLPQENVGCGKIIVAFLACMEVIGSGFQAAFMVPTELLAVQYYELQNAKIYLRAKATFRSIMKSYIHRLFSCRTSKDGESHIVEWNESEGAVKRAYQGFRKRSLGVVQFDTTKGSTLVLELTEGPLTIGNN